MKLYYIVPLEGLQLCSVCDLCKNIFHIQVSLFPFFTTPLIKLKLQIVGGLLIANHLDQSVCWANQNHWARVESYFVHSFLHAQYSGHQSNHISYTLFYMHSVSAHFTSHCKFGNYAEPNQHVLTFLAYIVLCKLICRDALICTHWCNIAPLPHHGLGDLDVVLIVKNCPTFLKTSLSILGKWYDKSLYEYNKLWAGSLTSS
jgi:hypothetical protein